MGLVHIVCYTNVLLFVEFSPLYTAAAYSMLYLFVLLRVTPLDLALLARHSECSDYLIAQGGKSTGGQVYQAVVTIQMAWRFYLHKVRTYIDSRMVNSLPLYCFGPSRCLSMNRKVPTPTHKKGKIPCNELIIL